MCVCLRTKVRLLAVACICLAAVPASGQSGYSTYTDWGNWATRQPGVRAGLASSYDRSGDNSDYCHYESPPGLQLEAIPAVARTISGPGVIHRFWMPHLTANREFAMRLFFDGESTPRIDTTSGQFFSGGFSYFTAPLMSTCAGGQFTYEPISFAQSLRIETFNKQIPANDWSPDIHYYQYTYSTYPPGTNLRTYDGSLTPGEQAARASVVDLFTHPGIHPAPPNPNAVIVPIGGDTVAPGTALTLLDQPGPGLIRRLHVKMESASDADLDGLRVRVFYDDESAPAIDVPVSCFFGAGHQRPPYQSLPMGTNSPDGFYSYWPMPFRYRIRVQLVNPTAAAIALDSALIEYESNPLSAQACYLRAQYSSDVKIPGQINHSILSANGRGHYAGNLLYIDQPAYSFSMLEGDEVINVDGTEVLYGTGLEDAYNGGYYFNWVGIQPGEPEGPMPQSAIRPLSGVLYVHREAGVERARADQFRWYLADRVPFDQSIEVNIENRYAVDGATWTSVAFYYLQPVVPGDANDDGEVNPSDIGAFVGVLLDQIQQPHHVQASDVNHDGQTNGQDIRPFVQILTGN